MFCCCHDVTSMMSLPKKYGNKVNVDFKARLEHKLYLARENPEPVFDVSECALKQVPCGIYSLCKVFRKRVLSMHSNNLSSLSGGGALSDLSLLTVLDLRSNVFTNLPPEIAHLSSLQELYLQENNIKKLPSEIGCLANLSILNVSKNNLKSLPEELGNLCRLTMLDISYNRLLQKLPKSLGRAQRLKQIKLDGLLISYPPADVLIGGTIIIVAFLANECGIDYSPESFTSSRDLGSRDLDTTYRNKDNDLQEQRQSALLEVEKNIRQQKEYELEVQSMHKVNKEKLLEDLAQQQVQLEQEIEKVQQERENNRVRLLSYIYNAEKDADKVIKEFLRGSEEERQSQAELVKREKREEMQLLSACHSEQFMLRTKDTLAAMERLLEEELLTERKLEEYTKFRDCTAQSLLSLEVTSNDYLKQIVQNQEKYRQDLVDKLRKDEALQKAAVAALLERSDARSWSIVQQVNLVQSQLAALTIIELERRKLEINQQLNDIADRRVTLSAILVNLLDQQEKRRQELLDTIKQIEQQRDVNSARRDSLFWLMQYQSLMEARPQGLLETLEPTLVRHVAIAGALHCLPFLSTLPSLLPNLGHEQLIAIGINSESDRAAIIMAVENYLMEKKLVSEEATTSTLPSAPPREPSTFLETPSAPPAEPSTSYKADEGETNINAAECVVCMDVQCQVIFLPCGHLCCCSNCANMITTECPMCRSLISRKIRVLTP
ncbi:E3 ubiquitin-protein ligase LRSAM1 isoform X2 [Orussus abietinus]|uniref:E3 ubiquitin-protein ligase LRSAM1 isoform X2 n=1 Tax=Orussus abietinus TaxID=222816 RepID=UPI000625006B|nr:E3 ubiquitin-protein ligase LRSAM1 isoform X2 [Orussus abietinus]